MVWVFHEVDDRGEDVDLIILALVSTVLDHVFLLITELLLLYVGYWLYPQVLELDRCFLDVSLYGVY